MWSSNLDPSNSCYDFAISLLFFLLGFFLAQDPILHAVMEVFHMEAADERIVRERMRKTEPSHALILFVTIKNYFTVVHCLFSSLEHSVVRAETLYSCACHVLRI